DPGRLTLSSRPFTTEEPFLVPSAAHAGAGLVAFTGPGGAHFHAVPSGDHLSSLPEFQPYAAGGFTADGTRYVGPSTDGALLVVSTDTWEVVAEHRLDDLSDLEQLYFSPDGRYLATISTAGAITLRDPATLERFGEPLVRHRSQLIPFKFWFSSDGRRMFSIGADGSHILWSTEDRAAIGDPFPADAETKGFAALDVNQVATIVDDDVLVWNVNTDEWLDIACRAAGRNMTRAEWEELGPADAQYTATCPRWTIEP
ncbi:MAG: hypothetical protein ACE5EV_09260, partial [Gaiellales bacterium]